MGGRFAGFFLCAIVSLFSATAVAQQTPQFQMMKPKVINPLEKSTPQLGLGKLPTDENGCMILRQAQCARWLDEKEKKISAMKVGSPDYQEWLVCQSNIDPCNSPEDFFGWGGVRGLFLCNVGCEW